MIRVQRMELPRQLVAHAAELTERVTKAEPEERHDLARGLWNHTTQCRKLVTPLRRLLGQMAHGNRCCMYCCDDLSTDVDHFEPLAVNPLRTFDWLNHLLACTACNSHHKGDRFPLDSAGEPLLIDPTREDPYEHLYLGLENGEYTGLTDKGQATLDVCGLNRDELPDARCGARDVVCMCVSAWQRGREKGNERNMAVAVRTIREQPFADVAQFMLRQAVLPKARVAFAFDLGDETLDLLRVPELRAALLV